MIDKEYFFYMLLGVAWDHHDSSLCRGAGKCLVIQFKAYNLLCCRCHLKLSYIITSMDKNYL